MLLVWFLLAIAAADWADYGDSAGVLDVVARRAQRDISMAIPVDQVLLFGVSLNRVLFDRQGYTNDAIGEVSTLLELGVDTLMVDVYWNEFLGRWQLCPAPVPANYTQEQLAGLMTLEWQNHTYRCQANALLSALVATVNAFFTSTNTNMLVLMLLVILNLRQIRVPEPHVTTLTVGNATSTSTSTSTPSYLATDPAVADSGSLYEPFAQVSSLVFTPTALEAVRLAFDALLLLLFYNQSSQRYPTLRQYLLNEFNRMTVFVASNELNALAPSRAYNFSSFDNATFFNASALDLQSTANALSMATCQQLLSGLESDPPLVLGNMLLTLHFRFVADNDDHAFNNELVRAHVQCGYLPILNSLHYAVANASFNSSGTPPRLMLLNYTWALVHQYLLRALWTWDIGREPLPSLLGLNLTLSEDTDGEDADPFDVGNDQRVSASQVAYSCAAMTPNGVIVRNCYLEYAYACRDNANPTVWHVNPDDRKNYFDLYLEDDCPEGYNFLMPRLNLEMLSLITRINATEGASFPVWVDLNDITVPQCFVTGGPYASCPYQRTVTYSVLVRMIAPSVVVAVVVLLLIFLERFVRATPIQLNRKRYWKKVIGEYKGEHAYEGVPS